LKSELALKVTPGKPNKFTPVFNIVNDLQDILDNPTADQKQAFLEKVEQGRNCNPGSKTAKFLAWIGEQYQWNME
jgi:hypothetical protein